MTWVLDKLSNMVDSVQETLENAIGDSFSGINSIINRVESEAARGVRNALDGIEDLIEDIDSRAAEIVSSGISNLNNSFFRTSGALILTSKNSPHSSPGCFQRPIKVA